MPNNTDGPYKYVLTAEQKNQLKMWGKRAVALGISANYFEALKAIHHQLSTDPQGWGDPWYRLHGLGLQVFQRTCSPLHLSYAVDEERRIVYVKTLSALPRSSLETDE